MHRGDLIDPPFEPLLAFAQFLCIGHALTALRAARFNFATGPPFFRSFSGPAKLAY